MGSANEGTVVERIHSSLPVSNLAYEKGDTEIHVRRIRLSLTHDNKLLGLGSSQLICCLEYFYKTYQSIRNRQHTHCKDLSNTVSKSST